MGERQEEDLEKPPKGVMMKISNRGNDHHEQKGVSEEEIAAYFMLPYFMTSNGSFVDTDGKLVPWPSSYWQMYYDSDPFTFYTVCLDTKTGDVLMITDPGDANG